MKLTICSRIFVVLVFLGMSQLVQAAEPRTQPDQTAKSQDESSANQLPDEAIFKKNWAMYGITYSESANHVEIVVDVSKLIYSWPALVEAKLVTNTDENVLKSSPVTLSLVPLVPISGIMLYGLHNNYFTKDTEQVKVYMLPPNAGPKELCYSFNINKATYKKIDQLALDDVYNLIVDNAQMSHWCASKIEEEKNALAATKEASKTKPTSFEENCNNTWQKQTEGRRKHIGGQSVLVCQKKSSNLVVNMRMNLKKNTAKNMRNSTLKPQIFVSLREY